MLHTTCVKKAKSAGCRTGHVIIKGHLTHHGVAGTGRPIVVELENVATFPITLGVDIVVIGVAGIGPLSFNCVPTTNATNRAGRICHAGRTRVPHKAVYVCNSTGLRVRGREERGLEGELEYVDTTDIEMAHSCYMRSCATSSLRYARDSP